MKKLMVFILVTGFLFCSAGLASANTITSSTMWFQGTLNDEGGGIYSGVLDMVDEAALSIGDGISGYDVYAKEGATAWFGDDPGSGPVWTSQTIANHDAWPTWNPDTPDWYQYSLNLYSDGGQYKWTVRNHPGSTAGSPQSTSAAGVPMSGAMNWSTMIATETDVGAYLRGTGTPEIPGGAASKGGGAGYWDMDWSWGSEAVPLQWADFKVDIEDLGGGDYRVSLTPVPEPGTMLLLGSGLLGLAGARRKFKK